MILIVHYKVQLRDGSVKEVIGLEDWPESNELKGSLQFEPMVLVTVVTPTESYGSFVQLFEQRRGEQIEVNYLDDVSVLIKYNLPWASVVSDLNDKVKSISSGYASFDYEEVDMRQTELSKVEIAINGDPVDAMSFVSHKNEAESKGRSILFRLQDLIPRQQFEIILQAKIGSKIIAKERIKPFRKDVLTKAGKTIGGGDVSRKRKLLEKQKKGKKRSKQVGKISVPQEAFFVTMKND